MNAIVAVVAENANAVRNMGYGRGLESDADAVGQQRMYDNGVDPAGMVHLLELLEREAADMPEQLAFLSSHPLTKERIVTARERAATLGIPTVQDTDRVALFRALVPERHQEPDTIPSSTN